MGFFSKILDKLGMTQTAAAATPTATAATTAAQTSAGATASAPTASSYSAQTVNPIAVVDVVSQLEERAAANSQKLNWRTSIVDLLKLLDIDSSLESRKALAKELFCPDDLMEDSAKMNMWLHKNVLGQIAANGGNVPQELRD